MAIPAQNQKPPLQVVPNAAPAAAPAQGPTLRKLKKGELLFAEGENSRAMYLVKAGMIRLYKKKGDASIELGTVHSGEVLGELAFLDGNPRSASGEALTECDLIEISGPTFQQVLTRLPDWLKILMKTIVGRLRSASTRIRQLESSSVAYDYSEKDGKRSQHYVYLSPHDALKICTGLILVGARNSQAVEQGLDIRVNLLQRYVNQVMGVPVAKITSLLDVLSTVGIVQFGIDASAGKVFLRDANFLEEFVAYLIEENLLEPSKRHDISPRGLAIMTAISIHLSKYKVDPSTGLTTVNVSEVKTLETKNGKEPFRMDEFQELVKLSYASNLAVKTANEVMSSVKADAFAKSTRYQQVLLAMHSMNEAKAKGAK